MPERPWVRIGSEDRSRDLMYVKRLELLVPGSTWARQFPELNIERTSLISYTGYVDTPLVYERAGEVVEAPKFVPSRAVGIRFDAFHQGALTNGSLFSPDVQNWSWVAFVESIGAVYTRDEDRIEEYRYAKAVRIRELRAYCFRCLEEDYPITVYIPGKPDSEQPKPRVMDEPLKQGLAVERHPGAYGEGSLGAICSVEKHPIFADLVRYNFQITENGEFVLNNP